MNPGSHPPADHWEVAEEIAQYVYRNPDRRVSVAEIAGHCDFSPFYLNRLFRSVTGESIYGFEKRARLGRAASRLLKDHGATVTEIAADVGYSLSNFTPAFRAAFGVSPSEWRRGSAPASGTCRSGGFEEILARIAEFRTGARREEAERLGREVRLERLEPFTVYRRRFRGPFGNLREEWAEFCPEAEAAGAADEARFGPLGHPRRVLGISYEDPLTAREDRFAYDLCIETAGGRGRRFLRIEGGTYARFDRVCPAREIPAAFNDLFGAALPARGLRMSARGVCFELYRDDGSSGSFDLAIYVPLELP